LALVATLVVISPAQSGTAGYDLEIKTGPESRASPLATMHCTEGVLCQDGIELGDDQKKQPVAVLGLMASGIVSIRFQGANGPLLSAGGRLYLIIVYQGKVPISTSTSVDEPTPLGLAEATRSRWVVRPVERGVLTHLGMIYITIRPSNQ
jgi:hypothetical protein